MLDVVRNEYRLSWFCAESAPLSVNAPPPSGPLVSMLKPAISSGSLLSVIGRYAPSQYCWKSLEVTTQLKFWPGGSSASPLPCVWLDLQNGPGGAPSGL